MSIGSVSGSGAVDATQLLEVLTKQRLESAQNTRQSGPHGPPSLDEIENRLEEQAQAAGVDVSKLHDLRPKIEAAVTEALKSYATSDDTSNPMDIVRNAVETTLKENGIDPEQLQQQFGEGLGGPGGAGGPGGPPPQGAQDPGQSSLDLQELKQRILAAIQESPDGTIDLSSLFSDLPVGSGVNVKA
jgi:hypothetical protein